MIQHLFKAPALERKNGGDPGSPAVPVGDHPMRLIPAGNHISSLTTPLPETGTSKNCSPAKPSPRS
jgi:hypothetical protein